MKELLTAQKIVEHMSDNGILFNIVNSEEAVNYLNTSNYYMKCASFRENYTKKKNSAGVWRYTDLEFAYLIELAEIDEELRHVIIAMALEIEHTLKVKLLNDIENNPDEDGYHIIQKFVAKDDDLYRLKILSKLKSSSYCKGLYDKYYPYFPVWVYVELISFSQLNALLNTYSVMYSERKPICNYRLLNSVRDLRNAAAHSNCLINKLRPGDNIPDTRVVNKVRKIGTDNNQERVEGFSNDAIKKKLKNKFIYDFICLLFLYAEVVSDGKKRQRYDELDNLFSERFLAHKEWYIGNKGNDIITSTYRFLKKVLDKTLA